MAYAHEWMESIPVAHMFFHWVQYGVMLGILAFSLRALKKYLKKYTCPRYLDGVCRDSWVLASSARDVKEICDSS